MQHTIYISSSMFRELDPVRLSTDSQKATVLFYPGATAGKILENLLKDDKFTSIQSQHVKKVFLLCGTNNVDRILNIKRSQDNIIVNESNTQQNLKLFENTLDEMEQLISFLQNWAHTASINVLNILPRESSVRNKIINYLNKFLFDFSDGNKNWPFCGP